MKRIQIITTGGTIAMKADPATGALTPAVTGPDLAAAVPGLSAYADIGVKEFSNIPSGYMTPEKMLKLAEYIDSASETGEADGFVVTHGTDTLEETAFFLDVALHTQKPVCVTGAMRGASDISADGPGNILGAVRTAADNKAAGMGVLVVLNDRIHAAWDVTKTHTTCTDTFQSPQWGPLGTVYGDEIVFGRQPLKHIKIHPESVQKKVWLLTCVSGMDGELFRLAGEQGISGIIIEGLGCGNVPPRVKAAVEELGKKGIPMVLVSRVPCGSVKEEYGYDGSARSMKTSGIILGGSLSGPKARLLLLMALGAGHDRREIQSDFGSTF